MDQTLIERASKLIVVLDVMRQDIRSCTRRDEWEGTEYSCGASDSARVLTYEDLTGEIHGVWEEIQKYEAGGPPIALETILKRYIVALDEVGVES